MYHKEIQAEIYMIKKKKNVQQTRKNVDESPKPQFAWAVNPAWNVHNVKSDEWAVGTPGTYSPEPAVVATWRGWSAAEHAILVATGEASVTHGSHT